MLSHGVKPVSVVGEESQLQCQWRIRLFSFWLIMSSQAGIFLLRLKCLISFLRVDGSDLCYLSVCNAYRGGEGSLHSRLRAMSSVIVERLVHNHQQIWLFFSEMSTCEIQIQSCFAGGERGKSLGVAIFQKGVLKSLLIYFVPLQVVVSHSPTPHDCISWPNWGRCCSTLRLEAV